MVAPQERRAKDMEKATHAPNEKGLRFWEDAILS